MLGEEQKVEGVKRKEDYIAETPMVSIGSLDGFSCISLITETAMKRPKKNDAQSDTLFILLR